MPSVSTIMIEGSKYGNPSSEDLLKNRFKTINLKLVISVQFIRCSEINWPALVEVTLKQDGSWVRVFGSSVLCTIACIM